MFDVFETFYKIITRYFLNHSPEITWEIYCILVYFYIFPLQLYNQFFAIMFINSFKIFAWNCLQVYKVYKAFFLTYGICLWTKILYNFNSKSYTKFNVVKVTINSMLFCMSHIARKKNLESTLKFYLNYKNCKIKVQNIYIFDHFK